MSSLLRARLIVALACVVASGGLLVGQQGPQPVQQGQTPTFRSSIEAVQVTAIVTDAQGNLVKGLTQDDFEILEDRRPQPITTFTAVDVPIEPTERALGEPDVVGNDGPPGRLYLIALDDMSADNALRSRFFLRQFIEKHFGPNDSAAVVLTTRGFGSSGQGFTSNPRLLLAAIDKFGGGEIEEGFGGGGGGFGGGGPEPGGLRVNNIMGSLLALTEMMATLPGRRKAMIFMSQSLGNERVCGCDADRLVGYRPSPLGSLFEDINADFHRAVSAATRGNVAIYPINPAGLTTDLQSPFTEERWQLDALARVTGGFALAQSNRYAEAFEQIVRENSTYYVLGFNSGDERRDGRYIPIEVRVKRPGLQVRSIDGYLAPRDKPKERPQTSVLAAVWNAVASPLTTSGVPMRVFAAPYKGKGKDATVAITLEIAANRLNLVEAGGAYRGDLEIVLAVTDQKNKRRPLMRHRAALALKPETYERVSRTAMRALTQLALPEGHYQLRVSAGGAALAGSVVYDLVVPDFGDEFALSGIALTSSETEKTFTFSTQAQIDVGLPGPPTTAREFSQEDTVTIYAEAYENRRRPHTIYFTTELRDASGQTVGRLTLERQSAVKPSAASMYAFAPNLVLAEVPAGRYVLRLQARSSLDARSSLTRDIPITVR